MSRINLSVLLNEPKKVLIFNEIFKRIRTEPEYRSHLESIKSTKGYLDEFQFAALETQEWIESSNQKQKENDTKRAQQAIEGIKK